jgi:hypothetical protein
MLRYSNHHHEMLITHSLTHTRNKFFSPVETTPVVTEETPKEDTAPAEQPMTEETKEMTPAADEAAPAKSMFAALCGCFGGKPPVEEEKPVVEEETTEDKPAEDKPTEEKA